MKKLAHKFVPALLMLSLAAASRGQTPAPVPAARITFASIDQISKASIDLGLPKTDLAKLIETTFALGDGSIDTTKPGGVLVLAGDALPALTSPNSPQLAILAIPVKEGKVTPDALKAAGAIAMDDKPGIFKLSKFYYRRLGGYVLIQMDSTLGLADIKEVPFANDYKTPGNLVVFSVDVAAVRKLSPQGYKQLFEQMDSSVPPAMSAAQAAGQKLGLDAVKTPISQLDKFSLAIADDGKNLHIKTWLTPLGPSGPAPKPVARPAFPQSTLGQIHVVYPGGDSSAMFKSFVDAVPHEAFGGMDKEHEDKSRALALRMAKLFGGQQAVSMGFNLKGGAPVFYIVPQFADNVDFAAEIKAIIASGNDLFPDSKVPDDAVSSYDSGGKKVTRVKAPGAGAMIDCISSGKVLYITVSPGDGKYVPELANAGLSPTTSSLICAGVLNLGAIFDTAIAHGVVPLAPEIQADIKKALDNQAITWTAQGADGKTLYVDVAFPKQVLGKAIEMFSPCAAVIDTPQPAGVDTMPPGPPARQ